MDRGAWWATVHRVTMSRTQLRNLPHCPLDRELHGDHLPYPKAASPLTTSML